MGIHCIVALGRHILFLETIKTEKHSQELYLDGPLKGIVLVLLTLEFYSDTWKGDLGVQIILMESFSVYFTLRDRCEFLLTECPIWSRLGANIALLPFWPLWCTIYGAQHVVLASHTAACDYVVYLFFGVLPSHLFFSFCTEFFPSQLMAHGACNNLSCSEWRTFLSQTILCLPYVPIMEKKRGRGPIRPSEVDTESVHSLWRLTVNGILHIVPVPQLFPCWAAFLMLLIASQKASESEEAASGTVGNGIRSHNRVHSLTFVSRKRLHLLSRSVLLFSNLPYFLTSYVSRS